MAVDISKQGAKGGDSGYDTSQLRGVREERGIVTGVVKANVHPTNMGVIKIWIPTFSTDENDKTQWRSVRYCTPFYSRVDNSQLSATVLLQANLMTVLQAPITQARLQTGAHRHAQKISLHRIHLLNKV
jgi:hypothetical protein